jgi:hypothetical protein
MRWTFLLVVVMTVIPVGAWERFCCSGSGPCVGSCATPPPPSPPPPPPPPPPHSHESDDYYGALLMEGALLGNRDRREATSECGGSSNYESGFGCETCTSGCVTECQSCESGCPSCQSEAGAIAFNAANSCEWSTQYLTGGVTATSLGWVTPSSVNIVELCSAAAETV